MFRLTAAGGFELRGGITHQENATSAPYYVDDDASVNRALFIGKTLYTVSTAKVKLNSLTDLSPIAEVKLD